MSFASSASAGSRRSAGSAGSSGAPGSLRIVRLANFVAPASGGLRTALRELGTGYLAAGHDPVLVIPGERAGRTESEQGTVITLPGPVLPGTGGYRVLISRRRIARLLERLAPDRLEVSDRTTLRWTGEWARHARVPAVMVSHETADGVMRTWGVPHPVAKRVADALNSRTAWAYTRIVCTTEWAEREFVRIGAHNVVRAPLGVDLEGRHPRLADPDVRARHVGAAEVLLVCCTRLSVEKRPSTALDAVAALVARGVRVRLVVAGDGPLKPRLQQRAAERDLPVSFLGHVADRTLLGALQASADVCLAPGPAETFGLAALEALACGTPVVVSASSALPQIIGTAGVPAADDGEAFADAVLSVLDRPEPERRQAARARAEAFGWDAAVEGFLRAHDALPEPVRAARAGAPVPDGGTVASGDGAAVLGPALGARDLAPVSRVPASDDGAPAGGAQGGGVHVPPGAGGTGTGAVGERPAEPDDHAAVPAPGVAPAVHAWAEPAGAEGARTHDEVMLLGELGELGELGDGDDDPAGGAATARGEAAAAGRPPSADAPPVGDAGTAAVPAGLPAARGRLGTPGKQGTQVPSGVAPEAAHAAVPDSHGAATAEDPTGTGEQRPAGKDRAGDEAAPGTGPYPTAGTAAGEPAGPGAGTAATTAGTRDGAG